MDRRTLTTVVICFAIFMAWQKFFLEPRIAQQQQQLAQQQTNSATAQPSQPLAPSTPATSVPVPPVPRHQHPSQTVTMPTSIGQAILGDDGNFFVDWTLKTYQKGLTPDAASIDLQSATNEKGQLEVAFDNPAFFYLGHVQGDISKAGDGSVLWTYEDSKVKMQRRYTADSGQPFLNVELKLDFKTSEKPAYAFFSLASSALENDPEANDRQLVYYSNDSLERVRVKSGITVKEVPNSVHFIGSSNRYFLMALVNGGQVPARGLIQPVGTTGAKINMAFPISGSSITFPFRAYFGPKELEALRSVDPTLVKTVDFGWFTFFAYPLLEILKWLDQYVRNYGIAIILLTILLKVGLYPLTYKSMKSMKQMAKIQPQLQKIREQYKDDKDALNRETLNLMRSGGYNPLAGCLPVVIQMPIFFALYRVLYSSIELYHAPLAGWIRDLSIKDPLYITPVLLSVTMYFQQRISPSTATDPTQQKMLQFMPLIFGFMMINLPAGLTLYMLTNAIMSIFQQLILNKKLNIQPQAQAPAVAAGTS